MDKVKNSPSPLRRKLLFTCIIGIVCLLLGVAMFLFLKDRMMLFLSLLICVFGFGRAFNIYRVIAGEEYEVVEGTCVAITPKPLRKIIDTDGNESSLLLGKHSKVKIGFCYRFYFTKTQHVSLGSEYFDAALSSDCFLGYEELGEFNAETTE